MTPSFQKWRRPEGNADKLREAIRHASRKKRVKLKDLRTEVWASLPNWFGKDKRYSNDMKPETYYQVVLNGFAEGWLFDGVYEQAVKFLGGTHPLIRQSSVKEYVSYRFSYLAKGKVLRGRLRIEYDSILNTVTTKEHYRIQYPYSEQSNLGSKTVDFERSGWLFSRGSNQYLMLSRKDKTKNEIQTCYLTMQGDRSNAVFGSFSDWHGDALYCANMYATLRGAEEDRLPLGQILTIEPEELEKTNPEILKYLTQTPQPGVGIVVLKPRKE